MSIYNDTIVKVQELLTVNQEWQNRYDEYVKVINTKASNEVLHSAQEQFSVPTQFHLYMPLSMVVNECSSKRTVFELRFHGQSVAKLYVDNNTPKNVCLKVKHSKTVITALESAGLTEDAVILSEIADKGIIDWNTDNADARNFRKIYSKLEKAISQRLCQLKGQPEHDMESYLLQNYAQKASCEKEISYIQPVTIPTTRARFQMPTPIRASDVKKGVDTIRYSKANGGGIDILARVGSGRKTQLAILELKDQNNKNEPPEIAINQAIAYATFLRELIRSNCGPKWWNAFGFSGQKIPDKLELKAIIVMPNENNPVTNFAQKVLSFKDSDDTIKLGYIYRETQNAKLTWDF